MAPDQLAQRLGQQGVVLAGVLADSPAAGAGLRPLRVDRGRVTVGDVIVALDGSPVTRNADLFAWLESQQPGTRVTVTVLRDGKRVDVSVTLAAVE